MGKPKKLRNKDLRNIGFQDNTQISLTLNIISKYYKHSDKSEKLELLAKLVKNPADFQEHEFLAPIADSFFNENNEVAFEVHELREQPKEFKIFGKQQIADNAIVQMEVAMQLPIAEKGALMPDAHHGYGLPIGGVLATKNEIIPYAVGVDIGCRMALSVYDVGPAYLKQHDYQLKQLLKTKTFFGTGVTNSTQMDHQVLESSLFREISILKNLRDKSARQLGTSGSGNHFVEFGLVELEEGNSMGHPAGVYLGLLTHSGSRGLGASIATHYSMLARDFCKLPRQAQHLAWLNMDTEAGAEYWNAMNLAGDYAKACHDVIHQTMAKELGMKAFCKVENHHNFAWKEKDENGQELIVHRKGATPAAEGVMGIIPGSMTAPGFIVSGKGNPMAINSASHGAGRRMSRKKAKESYTGSELKKHLKQQGVSLIGGGIDEAPIAYKNIEEVINEQQTLINIEGKFFPKIVRMDSGKGARR